ncbi:MAG: hypothetical protein C4520_13260 [Candidatus Abyssobacteria bacterium SURF_5]|uniref:Uncharacterized protein n=1 Tax=Abyssobacteria bacterium (strain SURF_5) TaxID=2093360 RepID=A0A3A4ND87_ABYX5|nr:MAG: hypothetical protein C4520_13260 [Candidatus Abyssubacteria bacterium SURF_5]
MHKRSFSRYAVLFMMLAAGGISCDRGARAPDADSAKSEARAVLSSIPTAEESAGWTPSGEPAVFRGEELFNHINGGADIYYEYGFGALAVQQYNKGEKAVSLEIYRMNGVPAAFGIYSYSRHPSLSRIEVGTDATVHSSGLFFWQDSFFVHARQLGSARVSSEEFLDLARAVSGKISATAVAPPLMDLLPEENRVPRSEVFVKGRLGINNQVYIAEEDLFGLQGNEAAAIARYQQPGLSLIIAQYLSRESCDRAYSRFLNHFNGSDDEVDNRFTASVMPGKYIAVGKREWHLVVIPDAESSDSAMIMLAKVSDRLP